MALAAWLGWHRPAGFQRFDAATAALEATLLCPAPVGALIASRRPAHPVGWLMLAIAGLAGLGGTLAELSRHFYMQRPDLEAVLFIGGDTLFKVVFVLIGLLLLVFPTGRLLSRRWSWPLGVAIVLVALATGLEVTDPGPLADYAASNAPNSPFGVVVLAGIGPVIGLVLFLLFLGFLLLAAVSVGIRFRQGGAELRLQLKWFMFAAALLVGSHIAGHLFILFLLKGRGWSPLPFQMGELAATAAMAVAVGVAILRHRLFDIELVISRTVAYGALAALIGAFYVAVVGGVGSLLVAGSSSRLLLAVFATAAVAAAFQPARTRLERLANRLVYGKRALPYEVLAEFTSTLDQNRDPVDLLPAMAQMLASGTACDAATVWLRENGGDVAGSTFPRDHLVTADAATRSVKVEQSGTCLGRLAVYRRSGQPLLPTEERLMDGLAMQAGLVLHNAGLQDEVRRRLTELRESRRRLVTAQDEARRRLERDLHDGAQQNLISLRMKLGLAAAMTHREPEALEPLLQEMQSELAEALDSLRTLARGVYPPLLEAEGLRAALRARARQLPLSVDVQCGEGRYARELEGAVYFCCSEALQNVAKHSGATRASVRVRREDGRLCFEVRDDGHGLDGQVPRPGGGLQNLRDRLDVLGGGIEVISGPEGGVSVTGWLPLTT